MQLLMAVIAHFRRRLAVPRDIFRSSLFKDGGWVGVGFFIQQALRFGTNIGLAWLLAPQLLGLMLLINTIRTGGDLLSDVGIGQSIVNNKNGGMRYFYNTGWTLQIIRGAILFIIISLSAPLFSEIYKIPDLNILLPVCAFSFFINGLMPPSRFLLQRGLRVRDLTIFDTIMTIVQTVANLGLAFLMPNIWALVLATLLASAARSAGAFFLVDFRQFRMRFSWSAAREIINFGQWIFISSLIFFAAMNFDRLYFASVIPLAVLGVYGVAKTLADALTQLYQQVGFMIIFPRIARLKEKDVDIRKRITRVRDLLNFSIAALLGIAVAISDLVVMLLYDPRYAFAGPLLTVMLLSTWFAVLGSMAEFVLMGIGAVSRVALANTAKLIAIVLLSTIAFHFFGFLAAVAALAAAEAIRYVVLTGLSRKFALSFFRRDLLALGIMICVAFTTREFLAYLGLASGIHDWFLSLETANALSLPRT